MATKKKQVRRQADRYCGVVFGTRAAAKEWIGNVSYLRRTGDEVMSESEHSTEQQSQSLEGGYYDGACTGEVQYGYSGNDNEQMGIAVKLVTGHIVTAILYFTPDAKDHSIEALKMCGWSGKGLVDKQIKDHPVRVGISYDEYQGRQTMKVKMKNVMSDSAKATFLEQLEAEAAASSAPAAAGGYPADWDKQGKPAAAGAAAERKGFSLRR